MSSGEAGNAAPQQQPMDAEQVKTFRDFLANYNKLSEICFSDCVWDFTSRRVRKGLAILLHEKMSILFFNL